MLLLLLNRWLLNGNLYLLPAPSGKYLVLLFVPGTCSIAFFNSSGFTFPSEIALKSTPTFFNYFIIKIYFIPAFSKSRPYDW